jgi:hypothetical protein
MFGHDNQNNQQYNDDTSATPHISPVPDDLVNGNDDHPSAPTFDTSKIALPSSHSSSSSDDDVLPNSNDHDTNDDLINIKQTALQQLSPLVDHLDQTPEEKFKTTMMMIQASDDQSLIKTAYDAAKQIKDDKVRAQALLDIINEINYFTQQNQN